MASKMTVSRIIPVLAAAAILIFPTLLPGGGNNLVQNAEATTYDITTDTTWEGSKQLNSGDVVNIAAGATLTINGLVSGYGSGEINVYGILKLVRNNEPFCQINVHKINIKSGGLLQVSDTCSLYSFAELNVDSGGTLMLNSGSLAYLEYSTTNVYGTINVNSDATLEVANSDPSIGGDGSTFINVYGKLNLDGKLLNSYGIFNINSGGTLNINSDGTLDNSYGTLNVNGLLDVHPGGLLKAWSGGILNIGSGILNIDGALDNGGNLKINKGGVLNIHDPGIFHNYNTGAALTFIYGTLNINNGAKLDNDDRIKIYNGGTLKVFTGGTLQNDDGSIYKECLGTFTLNPGASYTGNPITGQTCIVINDVSHPEGNSGTKSFRFTVTRSGFTTGTTTLNYATPSQGTATAGTDYTSKASTTLTFTADQTSKIVSITVNGDTTKESDERFNVRLSNCGGCTIVDNRGVGTIKNDDG